MPVREMKSDIRPLCDRHLIEMRTIGVEAKMGGTDLWTWSAFRCTEPECSRLFDSGYANISRGSVDPESRNLVSCEDGAMFIESVEEELLTWRCCKIGRDRSGTTDKAFHRIPRRFLRHLGAITGGPPDLSSRKGFSRR